MDEHQYTLGLGLYIDPATNLHRASEMLCHDVTAGDISIICVTKSVGEAGPDFLDASVRIRSILEPKKLKM